MIIKLISKMEEETKIQGSCGGARAGAGRKPKPADGRNRSLNITLSPEIWRAVRENVKKGGISAYIDGLIRKDIEQAGGKADSAKNELSIAELAGRLHEGRLAIKIELLDDSKCVAGAAGELALTQP